MKMRLTRSISALCLIMIGLLPACTTVNETGRRQFNIMSESQEMELGLTSFQEMKKETAISSNVVANAMLQRVGQRIAAVAQMKDAQWEFVLFESPEPNAFCLPGGKVGVYTGILPITKDEAGLATVIGHEVAHATARHGGERISQQMVLKGIGSLGSYATGMVTDNPTVLALFDNGYGLGSNLIVALPHSRSQESEADYIGLLYMARAGYNPEEAVKFWERVAQYNQQSGSGTPWFLRTHPLDETRIQDIKESLPSALEEYRPHP